MCESAKISLTVEQKQKVRGGDLGEMSCVRGGIEQ